MTRLKIAVHRMWILVDKWYWVWLILAAPFLLFPSANRSPSLLIIPSIWVIGLLAGHAPVRRTPLNVALFLMFVMVLASEWATYDLAFSLPKIAGMVLGAGVFFAVVRLGDNQRGWWWGLGAIIVFEVAAAGFALIGTNWLYKVSFLTPIVSRLPALIKGLPGAEEGLSANELAGMLLWGLPLLIVLLLWLASRFHLISSDFGSVKTRIVLALLASAACFIMAMLVLTQSRSGYIGFAVGLFAMTFLILSRRWQLFISILVLASVLATVFISQGNGTNDLAQSVWGGATTDPALSLDTLEGRVELWSRAIYGIQDFPFTGMGMNTFRKVVTVLYPFFLIAPDVDIAHAHNEFLQSALDLGIPGLIAFIAIYLITFWMLLQIWRGATQTQNDDGASSARGDKPRLMGAPSWLRAVALGFGGGLLAHIVYGMTDAVALGAKPGFIFWMMLGLIAALYQKVQSGQISEWQLGAHDD